MEQFISLSAAVRNTCVLSQPRVRNGGEPMGRDGALKIPVQVCGAVAAVAAET